LTIENESQYNYATHVRQQGQGRTLPSYGKDINCKRAVHYLAMLWLPSIAILIISVF
jgi:hypothetical protein